MIEKPIQVYFVYPTYSQGKKILWEGLDNEGFPIINYLPKELVASKNSQEMSIRLINGSFFKIVGSDEPDRLVGTNASFMVFSEYALQNPQAWQFLRQVVRANQGTAIFISTPRGRNHLHDLYQYAKDDPDWFVSKLTVDDTKHISAKDLDKERQECSEDIIQQEWFTSFDLGVEGSYYSKIMNQLKINNQIGPVAWNPAIKVYTAADIGMNDKTAIIFFQLLGNGTINCIDYHESSGKSLTFYAKLILEKPYTYHRMIWPHDMRVDEFTSGLERAAVARDLGLDVMIAPKIGLADGIEACKVLLPRCWFDNIRCAQLIKNLENYRQMYDAKKQSYTGHPLHDWACDGADAFRYLAVTHKLLSNTYTSNQLDEMYLASREGNRNQVPKPFQEPSQFGSNYQW